MPTLSHYKYNKVRERPSGTCHKLGLEGADKGSKLVWVWSFVEDRVVISFFEMRNLSKPKLQGAHTVHYKYNKVRERPSGTCHKLGLEGADKGSKLVWVWSFVEDRVVISFFEMRNLSKPKLQGAHTVHISIIRLGKGPVEHAQIGP